MPAKKPYQQCATCGTTDPSRFYVGHSRHHCRSCVAAYQRGRYSRLTSEEKTQRARDNWAKRYGVDSREYERLLSQPCEICGVVGQSVVDHEVDGSYCGVLCRTCNQGIGLLRHDPEVIKKAVDYVARTRLAVIVDR